ncbi:hypothetical protein L3Q82_007921 [Scortum barcoo]|uniref:Uncharacterized protein n=1 Tax=Scortum barcoo TaxID=214431 RepID=A0ACB8WKF9_9TELE|nr:hypothetical protein L3Q82_007921 [Scortum barcoo]
MLVRLALGLLLMQDNARPHVVGVCQQFLQEEGIDAMDWPALALSCSNMMPSGGGVPESHGKCVTAATIPTVHLMWINIHSSSTDRRILCAALPYIYLCHHVVEQGDTGIHLCPRVASGVEMVQRSRAAGACVYSLQSTVAAPGEGEAQLYRNKQSEGKDYSF